VGLGFRVTNSLRQVFVKVEYSGRELLSGEKEGLLQLPSDKALLSDPSFRPLVEKYAAVYIWSLRFLLFRRVLSCACRLWPGWFCLICRMRMLSLLTMLRPTRSFLNWGKGAPDRWRMLAQQFDRVVMWIPLHHVFLIADLLRRKVLPEKVKEGGWGRLKIVA